MSLIGVKIKDINMNKKTVIENLSLKKNKLKK